MQLDYLHSAQLFSKYLLGTVPGARDVAMSKPYVPCTYILGEGGPINYYYTTKCPKCSGLKNIHYY